MEKIPSFQIDHTKLKAGIYVSRKDTIGDETITTFDIRMRQPNVDIPMSAETVHTIEHIGATYLRNLGIWKNRVIYWGPMGCLTGFYFIVKGDRLPYEVLNLMIELFQYISEFEGDIPGATQVECGNYTYQNLTAAKAYSKNYLYILMHQMDDSRMYYPHSLGYDSK